MHHSNRPVKLETYFVLLRKHIVLFVAGIFFMGVSAYVIFLFSMITFMTNLGIDNVDYEMVEKEGITTTGIVTDMVSIDNTTINGRHPVDIYYQYQLKGNAVVDDVYRVVDPTVLYDLNVGDEVDVKYVGDQSMLSNYKPFEFPFKIIIMICSPFLVSGLIAVLYVLIRVLSMARLYKYGRIAEAKLIKTTPPAATAFTSKGVVFYQYETDRGQTVKAQSKTTDLFLFREKQTGDSFKIFVGHKNQHKSSLIPAAEISRNGWQI